MPPRDSRTAAPTTEQRVRKDLAVRAKYVLQAVAAMRQTIPYSVLGMAVNTRDVSTPDRAIGPTLDEVDRLCQAAGWPHLTVLVVSMSTGQPSAPGMAMIGVTDVAAEQERCWAWAAQRWAEYNRTNGPENWQAFLPKE